MSIYTYRAFDPENRIIEGTLTAEDIQSAAALIREKELHLMTLKEKHPSLFSTRPFHSSRQLSLLCRQWSALLSAGLPLTDTLLLMGNGRSLAEKELLESAAESIASGHSAADSLQRTGRFPPFFLAMIHSGEVSGTLTEELDQLSLHYSRDQKFRDQIKSALIYPTVILLTALSVLLGALLFILPSFSSLFDTLSIPIPPMTQAAIKAGTWLHDDGLYILGLLIAAGVCLRAFLKTSAGCRHKDRFLFSLFFIRRFMLIRFCRTLSVLLISGSSLSSALEEAAGVTGNESVKICIAQTCRCLDSGRDLSESLSDTGFTTPVVSYMIKTGMESGRLPSLLAESAQILEEDMENAVTRFRLLMEPALILFVGAITGFLVISIMLPILDTISTGLM